MGIPYVILMREGVVIAAADVRDGLSVTRAYQDLEIAMDSGMITGVERQEFYDVLARHVGPENARIELGKSDG